MKITRKFTVQGQDPFASVRWVKRSSKITNPDGSVVFQMDDAEVPETWSQLATDIMVSKYFRKAGVPLAGNPGQTGPEKSAKQVIHRLAGCWKHWGEKHHYFDAPNDAQAFYDELVHMLVHQMAAPNSPQWFNTGLNFAYGITGPAQGHFVPDPHTGKVDLAKDAYTHPQPHACFIQSVTDDLVNEGGIMDLWVREARLFKYGSGTGTNFSTLRAENEKLSGGGKSSGLMSWLKIGDRAASAIKSGGTTRRAAKMVCLDMDHPDILNFVNWKVREEIKVQAMVEGMKAIAGKKASAADAMTIGETAQKLGLKLDYDFNGEAYLTVSGQNSNNSVRIPDAFFDALDNDAEWQTYARTSRKVAKTFRARDMWDQIGYAAWRCADPGVQFDSTINAWHTCPGGGRINASNPCSEYMFLDNTACNLASINVLKFYNAQTRSFDVDAYEHAIDLWTIVLEISVLMASYPSAEVARLSYKYRTLGLGYANLGAMLMQAGIAYDSEEARAVCSTLTAILTGRAYRQSAYMAAQLGAFEGYEADKANMLRVIRNHRLAAHGVPRQAGNFEGLRTPPVPINHEIINTGRVPIDNADDLLDHAVRAWDDALLAGEKYGYRNAQVTVIAPTGTIGLLMDCDTTGIEPDFALVKFKKLAGGGYFKIANDSVEPALHAMKYSAVQTKEILTYLLGTLDVGAATLRVASLEPHAERGGTREVSFKDWLISKGLNESDIQTINNALPGVFELAFAFNAWTLGDAAMTRLGIDPEMAKNDPGFNLLRELGLSRADIEALNEVICGRQTVEGAPHLKPEHLPVFDCANKCGKHGVRFIAPQGHIRMMAAAQPFISGAISKTINLPNDASIQDIKDCYRLSWELGLKANALYRDGCKLSQPLSSTSDDAAAKEEAEAKKEPMVEVKPLPAASATPAVETPVPSTTVGEQPIAPPPVPAPPEVRIVERPMRRRLTDTRASITHKFNIAGHEGYLTVGLYEDGMPGELFITMAKEGSTIGGLMDSLGTAVSVALQYGVPIESLVNKFTHQRFEPAGMTTNRDIPFAKSLVDYIFRWMGMEFIPGYREANAPKRSGGVGGMADSTSADDSTDELVGDRFFDPASHAPSRAMTGPAANRLGQDDAERDAGDHTAGLEDRASWNTHSSVRASSHQHAPATTPAGPGAPGGAPGVHVRRSVVVATHSSVAVAEATGAGAVGGGGGASVSVARSSAASATVSALSMAMRNNQEDAPACDGCGAITVRSGTCYKCLNCGASMGCS
ncbi:MAG TPA: adenosylcobalamin-dependent ribonucleoside-diphosphate reductase [Phycisphaerales bacterium]|nr:adenosylcobalamin-dependent ribonucleoside-diphosphate reductase [Phycisphaerales bacterium]